MSISNLTTRMIALAFLLGSRGLSAQPVTDAQVRKDVDRAHQFLEKMWITQLGSRFKPPSFVYYTTPRTCGKGLLGMGNAAFCPVDNTIYVDAGFIRDLDKAVGAKLGSSGDYAGVAIIAHEYGHAVERATAMVSYDLSKGGAPYHVLPATEGAADCFSGAATRQAKAEGQLAAGKLAEALMTMEFIGDDKVIGFDSKSPGALVAMILLNPDHGFSDQRQAAFLRGYYGGPRFCTGMLGTAKAPAAGRAITSQALVAPEAKVAAGAGCAVSSSKEGTRVRNTAPKGSCVVNLLGNATQLPDHARIEVTVKLLGSLASTRTSPAGVYFGDGGLTGKLVRFGQETCGTGTCVTNIDGEPAVLEPSLLAFLAGLQTGEARKDGKQTLTLDIHHEGTALYFMEYLNGVAVSHNALWQHGKSRNRFLGPAFGAPPDQAGLWLREPGAEAIFTNFRVLALPE